MFLSWLHKAWKLFLTVSAILFAAFATAAVLAFGLLQLPQSRDYIALQITELFNEQYEGTLHIDKVGGLLPFRTDLHGIRIYLPGNPEQTVLTAEKATLSVNLWDLLQRRIMIRAFELQRPLIRLHEDDEGNLTLEKALGKRNGDSSRTLRSTGFNRFELYAPSIEIRDGKIIADGLQHRSRSSGSFRMPASFSVENVQARFYLELAADHQLLDIEHLTAELPGTEAGVFSAGGQIFSTDELLEFNGFRISTGKSRIEFTGDASGVGLFSAGLAEQISSARFRIDVKNSRLHGEDISWAVPSWPFKDRILELELQAGGTMQSLFVDRMEAGIGNSSFLMDALFEEINTPRFRYRSAIDDARVEGDDLERILNTYTDAETGTLADSRLRGKVQGDLSGVDLDIALEHGDGGLQADASLFFEEPLRYEAEFQLDSLDLSPFLPQFADRNLMNGRIELNGSGLTRDELSGRISADLDSGYVNHIEFTGSRIRAAYNNGLFEHELAVENGRSEFHSGGSIRNRNNEWSVSVTGGVQNFDIRKLSGKSGFPATSLSLEYSSDLRWTDLDDLSGRVDFEVRESVIGPDTLRPHQFYADIDSPPAPGGDRNLRLTSSFLDAELRGALYPRNLHNLYRYWEEHITSRVAEEITMQALTGDTTQTLSPDEEITPVSLGLDLEFKDMDLLRKYLAGIPSVQEMSPVESRSRISLNLNADEESLLLTGSLDDPDFRTGSFSTGSLRASLTAGFLHGEKLRDNGTFDLQVHAENYRYGNLQFGESNLSASMRSDSLVIHHSSNRIADEVNLDFTVLARLFPDSVNVEVQDFYLGNDQYEWIAEGNPEIIWSEGQTLALENLVFTSDVERIEVHGTYSSNPLDSVLYKIRNLRLDRISDLAGGRISFSGIADGDLTTQTLTQIPSLEGSLDIRRLTLNNRLIGDVNLNSRYSTDEDRFNTQISVLTDPEKYPGYLEENDQIGQNLLFEGYFTRPDLDNPDQEFFYFDADLEEIDMWIVTVIVPGIVTGMEGRSSGRGFIRGSLTDYDFHAEFDIDDVAGIPVFLNTRYLINGRLVFDRYDGLVFDNLELSDEMNGTGRLYGTIDLDNFSGTSDLDLTLDFSNLQFMNNPYDPDVPFYANARGSGQARITGPNVSPFLRTTRPIELTPGSSISVPVLDDTELQQNQNFIQFVDTFDWRALREREENGGSDGNGTDGRSDPGDLTFSERFTLDLQFTAQNPVNFQLVFDRVTNEILTANGTGLLRLNLADQNFSLFGRMNISSGNYQFVAGDIISRRFRLLEGGSIIWEGDPANARLNVNATYRSRPDLASLVTSGSTDHLEGAQRSPVDLILNIGGTLNELENDFYFQVPSSIEGTLDPTLLTQINALNRNEEEKVIQATSILLTGNFIPLTTASTEGGTGMALRESLTSGSVVVNPLITSQVINPLLSDQINSLLRNDMALDIDFNLTQYNQVDLGVALRLYDDRLVFRRDGQITGPYSDIGDLGATYRINRTFAVTAFHRQDPALTNTSTTEPRQIQEMNGVGLEAQFQFNTWGELKQRFVNLFNRLFGIKEDDNEGETYASD